MSDVIINVAFTVVVIALIGYLTYLTYKRYKGKEEANEFLDGLKNALCNQLLLIIKNFNYDDYDNLVGIELEIVNQLSDAARDYIEEQLEKSSSLLSAMAIRILSPQFINYFIDNLINTIDLDRTIENQLGDKYERFVTDIEKEEKELETQYNNSKLYYIDEDEVEELQILDDKKELPESDDNGLEERGFTIPSKEEEQQLNPQVDEEEVYDATDISMEIVPEETTYVDSRGRVHDKATGKFIKSK